MRIGFLNNQIDNRGTGNALYDYAHYNEEILGNESFVLSLDKSNPHKGMEDKLLRRFKTIYSVWDIVAGDLKIDFLYHIKYGYNDGFAISGLPYGVHAVFDAGSPHGDRYATISQWMGERYGVPFVPHIIQSKASISDFRYKYAIPQTAKVFGRHGGADTFDIPFVWSAINRVLKVDPLIYFVFMNTERPDVEIFDPRRVIFISETSNDYYKFSFINACDAMLHARGRGETFGVAVGEFAVAGKVVFTYGDSPERAHIQQLGGLGYLYYSENDLVKGLLGAGLKSDFRSGYDQFTPDNVMEKFKEVYL